MMHSFQTQCRVVGRVANLKDYYLLEHDPNHHRKRNIPEVRSLLLVALSIELTSFRRWRDPFRIIRMSNGPRFRSLASMISDSARSLVRAATFNIG